MKNKKLKINYQIFTDNYYFLKHNLTVKETKPSNDF